MLKEEFERLAGYEVSPEDYYKVIEPMYGATDLTKAEFVKCLDRKRFALKAKGQYVKDMKKIARHLYDICGRYTDFESLQELDKIAREYATRFYHYNSNNLQDAFWFENGYEYPELKRGCTYPKTLVIYKNGYHVAEIDLV